MMSKFKEEEIRKLSVQIEEWNASRLDMFTLSQPDENLEFFGVMRFFFQEDPTKVTTKCVRVASTATCYDVIGALIEKFRPDMKMLADRDYSLYEVHEGEERKMMAGERPLLVQLNWTADDREGRFMLKELNNNQLSKRLSASAGDLREEGMERKLSRRQRRQLKKQRRQEQKLQEKQQVQEPQEVSSFMRSLSNPELVLRKRRQVKLEKKLNHINSSQNGGTLKIYGHSLKPDVPYKTLLLSTEDKVEEVVAEALEKYGLEHEDPDTFCLVQVMMPPGREEEGGVLVQERVMQDEECPLAILMQHPESLGIMRFHLRLRPPSAPKKRKTPQVNSGAPIYNPRIPQVSNTPFLLPIRADGTDRSDQLRCFLGPGRTVVGSKETAPTGQFYMLASADIFPEHCDIVREADGRVWVERRMGEVMVDGQRCFKPTPLLSGSILQIGNSHIFKFIDPSNNNNNYNNKDIRNNLNNSFNPSISNNNNYFANNTIAQNIPYSNKSNGLNINNFNNYNPNDNSYNSYPNNYLDNLDSNRLNHSPSNSSIGTKDLETTFDLEGHVITAPTQLPIPLPIQPSNQPQYPIQPSIQAQHPIPQSIQASPKSLNKLPAMFFVNEQGEDVWLDDCTHRLNFASLHFKVAPSFLFYTAIRSKLPDIPSTQRLASKIASRVASLVQDNPSNPPLLSFWLSNSSELFNFLRQDQTLSSPTLQACNTLLQVVQGAFGSFLECLQVEMELTLPSFVNPHPDTSHFEEDFLGRRVSPTLANLLHVLTLAMSVLRRCRVNAGITIQIFSQLFKFANAWLFNCILLDSHIGLCSREWAGVVRERVGGVVAWAEKQGLELAAQCHFAKSIQLCLLLEAPKSDLQQFTSTFPLLNPLQIQTVLHHFQPPISPSLLDFFNPNIIPTPHSNSSTDSNTPTVLEGDIEESLEACPTLVLPEDGFTCDSLHGLPQAFIAFADAFQQAGFGRFVINSEATGSWKVYMETPQEEAVQTTAVPIRLKKVNKSLGVSIVSAKASEQMVRGIYVKSVVKGGAAQMDGRLEPGDQLLSVGNRSLVGVTQEKAAQMMAETGEVVELMVLKQGALHNNLPSLMPVSSRPPSDYQPSPQLSTQRFSNKQEPIPQPRNQHPPIQQQQQQPNQLPLQHPIQQPIQQQQQQPYIQTAPMQQSPYDNPHSLQLSYQQQTQQPQRNMQQPLQQQPLQPQPPTNQQQNYQRNAQQPSQHQVYERLPPQQPQQQLLTTHQPLPQQPQQQPLAPKPLPQQRLPQQPLFRDSSQIEMMNSSFQSTHPSSQIYPLTNLNQVNPNINHYASQPQPSNQHGIQATSSLLTNLKLTRPLSSLSSKKPGYASQVLFPKTQQTSTNNTNNPSNNYNNDFNNNNLKTSTSLNNNPPQLHNPTIPQMKLDDNSLINPSNYPSPPLPSPNNTPSFQHQHQQQHHQGSQDFPSPPMHIQMNKLNINTDYNSVSSNIPTSIQPTNQPIFQPTYSPNIPSTTTQSTNPSKPPPPPVPAKPRNSMSPWEREAMEKRIEEERKGRQMQEMLRLQANVHRTSEEEQRFRRLQTEEEFERRAKQEQFSPQLSLKTPLTPGASKKSVTFSENVGVNEYHRSFSSTSSDPPPSPLSHHPPSSSLPINQPLNQPILQSNQISNNQFIQPIYQSSHPSTNPPNPSSIYQQTQPQIYSSVQPPIQQVEQVPIYPQNSNPNIQTNQPRNNASNYVSQPPSYQPAYPSNPTSHLFENTVYVPPNVIQDSSIDSQQSNVVHLAKIKQGPSYEAPANYQLKAKIIQPQQPYQQTQPTYDTHQAIYNQQQTYQQQQQQPTYQQQQQQQRPNYYSQQQDPIYQQQQLTYPYNKPERSLQQPQVSNPSFINNSYPQSDQPIYSRQYQNQNIIEYNYD